MIRYPIRSMTLLKYNLNVHHYQIQLPDSLSEWLSDSLSAELRSKSSLIRFSILFSFIAYWHSSKSVWR